MKLSPEIKQAFEDRGARWATQRQSTAAGHVNTTVINFRRNVSPGANATLYRVWATFEGDLSGADCAQTMGLIDAAIVDVDAAIARHDKPAAHARLAALQNALAGR